MSDDIAISVENVSKAYRIWNDPGARLKSPLLRACGGLFSGTSTIRQRIESKAAGYYRDFYALKDISFQVRKGESVGIIGRNGSGKSTILQIIAGTLQPTTGSVRVNGRVAALLELGSGFNPEFTGRENVYLNASLLGLTRAETDSKFDAIASFADIGDFLDQPVKMYSSGMVLRLAFSCAVAVEPSVLIVDEALSVGDVFFQQKCFTRIRQILDSGTTLLLVSHDLAAVQNLCRSAILLDGGSNVYQGPPEECVSRYYANPEDKGAKRSLTVAPVGTRRIAPEITARLLSANILIETRSRHGDRSLELLAARLTDGRGEESRYVEINQHLRLDVWIRANRSVASPGCGIHLFDRMNNMVFGAGTPQLHVPVSPMTAGDEALISFRFTCSIQPGPYTFNISLAEPDLNNPNLGTFFDVCEGLGPITVVAPANGVWPFYGIANLPMTIEVLYG